MAAEKCGYAHLILVCMKFELLEVFGNAGGAAIDAPATIVVSFQLFEGETSFESPAVHLAAGGEFRIKLRFG